MTGSVVKKDMKDPKPEEGSKCQTLEKESSRHIVADSTLKKNSSRPHGQEGTLKKDSSRHHGLEGTLKKDSSRYQGQEGTVKKDSSRHPGPDGTLKKDSSRHHGKEGILKKFAPRNHRPLYGKKAKEEEARLAKEKELQENDAALLLLNAEDKYNDLIAWIKSVPLSESCIERIDRSFSDGSLLAELIHHFCPSICDSRQYFRWNSKVNKIRNWQALNNKVFPKLGFVLNQKQIDNILNPFQCSRYQKDCQHGLFIYKLLSRIRKELAAHNPRVFDYRKSTFVPPPACEKKPFQRKFVNFLEHPAISKVQWLLEQGYYDDETRQGAPAKRSKSACCAKSASCSNSSDDSFQSFLNFPTNDCMNFYTSGLRCDELLRTSLSCKWTQPSISYFCQ